MWTPFRKKDNKAGVEQRLSKEAEHKAYGDTIGNSKCAILYYVGADDSIAADFKFDGSSADAFISLFTMINTGQLHDMLLSKVIETLNTSGATQEQITAFLGMLRMVTEVALKRLEEEGEEDPDAPLVLPMDVFNNKEELNEQ